MDGINQVVFILLGGYVFLITLDRSRFLHYRIQERRLIFHSILAGLGVAILTFYLRDLVYNFIPRSFVEFLWNSSPLDKEFLNRHKMFGRTFMCIPMAIVYAVILNVVFSIRLTIPKIRFNRNTSLKWVTTRYGDDFEKLFWEIDGEEDIFKMLVSITLKNNKIYIGWLREMSRPMDNSHISIFPFMSGYRESETKVMWFTTDYWDLYQSYYVTGRFEEIKELMEIRIIKDEVLTMNRFNLDFFEKFNPDSIVQTEQSSED